MATPAVENTLTPEQINMLFNQHAARIAALEARPAIHDVADRSAVIHQRALEIAHVRFKELFKEGALASGSAANVLLKTAVVVAAEKTTEEAAKKGVLKMIPVIGVVFGVTLGVARAVHGDHWSLVAGEVISGAASLCPGYGTAISMSIDSAILVADVKRTYETAVSIPDSTFTAQILNLREAYACIGINYEEGNEPDRGVVDRQYRNISTQYHPDTADRLDLSNEIRVRYTQFMVCINAAKALIDRHRGWR